MATSVLIVEDDENARASLRLALRREGNAVAEAASAEEGLPAFQQRPTDVVLVDLMLPRHSGNNVCMTHTYERWFAMAKATGTFDVAGWDEQPYDEWEEGGKLTRASVKLNLSGDIEGEGAVEWLMCYRPDGTAHYVGLLRVTGAVGGRKGSVVLENNGEYDGTEASGPWTVVQGSGTGELTGITGAGTGRAPSGGSASFELEYELG